MTGVLSILKEMINQDEELRYMSVQNELLFKFKDKLSRAKNEDEAILIALRSYLGLIKENEKLKNIIKGRLK